ncbi:hypothetical protein [Erwinia psidii]|uniref:hypothetical protein n=1 Tax=Erwinia psidii TaxID=69224 RepID=UPI0013155734|nr:hypothetical protein [Erwinia psidii]
MDLLSDLVSRGQSCSTGNIYLPASAIIVAIIRLRVASATPPLHGSATCVGLPVV